MTDPASFRAGAEAMRARIIAGIRRWWGDARRSAGHRWPGHPHWLEVAVARLSVDELLGSSDQLDDQRDATHRAPVGVGKDLPVAQVELDLAEGPALAGNGDADAKGVHGSLLGGAAGLDRGADALDADAEGGGELHQGAPVRPLAVAVAKAKQGPRSDSSLGAERCEPVLGDHDAQQVVKSLGALSHGGQLLAHLGEKGERLLDSREQIGDIGGSKWPRPTPVLGSPAPTGALSQPAKEGTVSTVTLSVPAAQLLLGYTLPITDLDARVLSRTAGYWSQDDHAEPTAFVEVSGRCGGSPFTARVTVVGWEGEERLFAGCAQDVADEARWHLEPFLGELSRAQVEALVAEVTDAAKEVA